MMREQHIRLGYGMMIMLGCLIVVGMMLYKRFNGDLDSVMAVEVGMLLSFAACIGIYFLAIAFRKEVIDAEFHETESRDLTVVDNSKELQK